MKTIRLGQDGPRIKAMGIGTWAWGDRLFWGFGQGYGKEDLRQAFQASVEAGVTLFDTAEIYGMGRSEEILGEFAQKEKKKLLIASKCFPYPYRLRGKSLKGAIKSSLKRLKRERIDLYQMHWPTPIVRIESWMHTMADAVEEGLIGQIGVSNYSPQQMERAHKTLERRGHKLASNQVLYSLLDRQAEQNGLLRLCAELGVTVIAYSPLAQGLLTGKYGPERPPSGVRRFRVSRVKLERSELLVKEMREIGERHGGKSAAQVAVNWTMQKGTLPIPGAKNKRQAEENAGTLGWDLNEGDVERLDEISDIVR